jgi:hypothetical protein
MSEDSVLCCKGAHWRSRSLIARNLFRPSPANATFKPGAGGYLAQFLAAGRSGRQGACIAG